MKLAKLVNLNEELAAWETLPRVQQIIVGRKPLTKAWLSV